MDWKLIFVAIVAFSVPALADPEAEGKDDGDKFWPGMWLFNSENEAAIHLGPSKMSKAWPGPTAYLRHHDAGIRKSAARWLRALGKHAQPAIPNLLAILDDESEEVRAEVEGALDRIDPDWKSRPAEELEELAAEAPQHVKIEAAISAYGFPLRGRPAIFPLEVDAEFGIEVTIKDWFGRPRPADLDLAIRDTVVFGIGDPERFAEAHLGESASDGLKGARLELTLAPMRRPDGLWSFTLERADVFGVYSMGE